MHSDHGTLIPEVLDVPVNRVADRLMRLRVDVVRVLLSGSIWAYGQKKCVRTGEALNMYSACMGSAVLVQGHDACRIELPQHG